MLISLLLLFFFGSAYAAEWTVEGSGENKVDDYPDKAKDNDKLSNLVLRSESACYNSSLAVFIRVPQALVMGIPTIVSTVEMLDCATFCRNNSEPLSGLPRPCKGFNFQSNVVPTCEFFDDQSKVGVLNRNVGERSYYFDKICLPEALFCGDRAFAFDVIANARLSGGRSKRISVQDRTECLSMCLNETEFMCYALNYDNNLKSCEMYNSSRRSMGVKFTRNVQDIDYYENNCLDKESRCPSGQIGFVKLAHSGIRGFDMNAGVKLLADCLLDCIESRLLFCRSVEYDSDSNECYVSEEDTTTSDDLIVTDPAVSVDLYEPICLPGFPESMCSQSYIYEKLRATYMQTAQTLTTLVELHLEDCLLACMDHGLCRALNYDKLTGNCELLPFGRTSQTVSLKAVDNIDFYELTCTREGENSHSFITSSRITRTRKFSPSPFTLLKNDDASIDPSPTPTPEWRTVTSSKRISVDLSTSTSSPPNFSSTPVDLLTTVDRKTPDTLTTGTASSTPRTPSTPIGDSSSPDPTWSPTSNSSDSPDGGPNTTGTAVYGSICGFRFQGQDRKIKDEFRADRLNIPTLKQCQQLCEALTDFHCASVSYSIVDLVCGMSDYDLNEFTLDQLTQDEDGTNFYGREECLMQNDGSESGEVTLSGAESRVTFAAPVTRPRPVPQVTLRRDSTGTARAPSPPSVAPISEQSPSSTPFSRGSPPAARPDTQPSPRPPATRSIPTTLPPPPPPRPNSPAPVRPPVVAAVTQRPAPTGSPIPRRLPAGNGVVPVAAEDILVEATCLQEGVNISITIRQGAYTGAVYAAERFAECRNIVIAKAEFWIYLPRPVSNSACNTLEVNDVMTGVIVISNDRVLPHDVTTKEDLFYQISCNYSFPSLPIERRFFIRSGVVVGGPAPRLVSAEELRRPSARDLDVRMKILRNGRTVDSVLIGEQLTLSIESSEPPHNMKLMDCNVTRIGGGNPPPLPLRLVEEGCAAMAQIMGPIKHGNKGLEATLTAFRIDGSAEIEIDCGVMICRDGCAQTVCTGDGNSLQHVEEDENSIHVEEKKRTRRSLGEEDDQLETVDGRLRVFVAGEKGAPDWMDIASSESQYDANIYGQRCISETVFITSVGSLSAILILVLTAFGCLFCRQSLVSQLIIGSSKLAGSSGRTVHGDYIANNRRRVGKKVSFRDAFSFSRGRQGVEENTLDRPHVAKPVVVSSQM